MEKKCVELEKMNELKINLEKQFLTFKAHQIRKMNFFLKNLDLISINRQQRIAKDRIREQKYVDEIFREYLHINTAFYSVILCLFDRVKQIKEKIPEILGLCADLRSGYLPFGNMAIFRDVKLSIINLLDSVGNEVFSEGFIKLEEALENGLRNHNKNF